MSGTGGKRLVLQGLEQGRKASQHRTERQEHLDHEFRVEWFPAALRCILMLFGHRNITSFSSAWSCNLQALALVEVGPLSRFVMHHIPRKGQGNNSVFTV